MTVLYFAIGFAGIPSIQNISANWARSSLLVVYLFVYCPTVGATVYPIVSSPLIILLSWSATNVQSGRRSRIHKTARQDRRSGAKLLFDYLDRIGSSRSIHALANGMELVGEEWVLLRWYRHTVSGLDILQTSGDEGTNIRGA